MVVLASFFLFFIPKCRNQLKNEKYWVTEANVARNTPSTHKNNVFYAYLNCCEFYDCHGIINKRWQYTKIDVFSCLLKAMY